MKKLAALVSILALTVNLIFAQDVEKLPDDPRVKSGVLANGLSYILIKNKAEAGYAHFGIAQRVGTTLEGENEKGMFKMLEALTVRGTRNFTDSTILSYLKSIGVPSQNVTFKSSDDDITYLIKGVPVAKGNSVDSSLLILYNWLGSINIDEEEIREEIPFVKNRLLNEWDAAKRLDDKLVNELYPDSGYATDIKFSDIEQIGNFTSKDLRNFYYKWFRPDFQSVIVVGDIDTDLMETKVKSIFSTIPKPLDLQERTYYDPEPFDGVKAFVLKDKEYDKTKISIEILKEPLKAKYKLTSVPFIQEYMDEAIANLLSARLREGIINRNLPVTNLYVGKGRFMNIHNQDAFTITFEALPEMVYSAIAFVNSEVGKMAKYGFNGQEFGKSKDIYFRNLEALYDNRNKLENDHFLKRALDHFYDGCSMASVELKFEIMKEILFTISLKQLNQYAAAMLGQSDNIVISCRMPEYRDVEGLSVERILSAYVNAELSTPSIAPDAPVLMWPYFKQESSSAITSSVTDPVTGANVLILSNGATVVLKQNLQSDTVSFKAVSKGGYSLMSEVNFGNESYLNDIVNLGGLGNFSQPNMERLFSYNNMSVRSAIGQNVEYLEGYSHKSNIEKLFHAINLSMTERRADESAFGVYKKGKIYEVSHRSLSPSNVFKDSILHYNYSNKNYVKRADAADLERMEYTDILYRSRERFSNAADFVFILVGDFNVDECKELAVKYIGSIPGNVQAREEWLVVPNYLAKGTISRRFLYRMINPRTYSHITNTLGVEFNLENSIKSSLLKICMDNLLESRDVRRYVTRWDDKVELRNYPEEIFTMQIMFETDSLNAQRVGDIVQERLDDIAAGKIGDDDFAGLKLRLKGDFLQRSATNIFWIDLMELRYMAGKDFYGNYMKVLESLTKEEFEKFVSDIVAKGNRISIIMDGTTKDVNTQNLFKEDEFIKDFFDVD